MLKQLERILPPFVIVGIIAQVTSLGIQIAQYGNPPQVLCPLKPTFHTEMKSLSEKNK